MDRTPLGGGAMVGLQLARHWKPDASWRLSCWAPVPRLPTRAAQYVRLAARPDGLVELGELAYARFCADFEAETTDVDPGADPGVQAVGDRDRRQRISEGPTLGRLAHAGYRVLSIWHVDVVDYFNKLYLRRFLAPERLTRVHEKLRAARGRVDPPAVLNLVFDKQRETVVHSTRIIVPSTAMIDTIRRCYGELIGDEELGRPRQGDPLGRLGRGSERGRHQPRRRAARLPRDRPGYVHAR